MYLSVVAHRSCLQEIDMKKTIVALVWLVIGLAGFSANAQFRIVGYVPNWEGFDLTGFSAGFNYSRVTHINIAFKDPNASGDLPAMTSGEIALLTAAHNNGVQVLISLGGAATSTNAGLKSRYFTLINSTNRKAFCSKLKQYVVNNNLDGIDIDLEGTAINGDYGSFIQVLADSLHPAGKLLTSALSEGYGGASVPVSTFAYFDWINIMAYDACGPTWGSPGQHSSYAMAQTALNYWKGRGLAKSKAVLGVPFYGYEFGTSSPSQYGVPFSWVGANRIAAVYDDQVATTGGNTVYYNGISTIQDKTSLAMVEGGGIMIWELSLDATGNNSLLKNIREIAGSMVTGVDKNAEAEKFAVYPNPTNGPLSIQGDFSGKIKAELYNAFGAKIKTFTEAGSFDLSEEPKGIYYIHITGEGTTKVRKIVLQ